jgi:hypothetical protein
MSLDRRAHEGRPGHDGRATLKHRGTDHEGQPPTPSRQTPSRPGELRRRRRHGRAVHRPRRDCRRGDVAPARQRGRAADQQGRRPLPEIAAGAVRSSELRDGGIRLDDVSTTARNALQGAQGPAGPAGVAEARIASKGAVSVPQCSDQRLIDCPDLLTRTLDAGDWIVQAKLDVSNGDFNKADPLDHCGLEQESNELDRADFQLAAFGGHADLATIALAGVVTDAAQGTTVSLRCSEGTDANVFAAHLVITAMKVSTVVR